MEHWRQVENLNVIDLNECEKIQYYTREMKVGTSCIQEYKAHIFICFFSNAENLKRGWEHVNNNIAITYQSNVEKLIEKSNFYICYFVSGIVKGKIKSEIESDSFCAKKYIFEQSTRSIEECCDEVENRIFKISSKKEEKKGSKLSSIELQNFRVFEGNVTIRFKDKDKKAASFVAIYAKNGVGKTSLFDSIEYALTGEVNRLKELKEKGKGAVYHNRRYADKKAYVKLTLDNGKNVLRNVANVAENGNDCRRNQPVEGKEIVGTTVPWNQTLLPHNKIDSFISAKKPTAQYEEWIKSTGVLNVEGEGFIKAHEYMKNIDKDIRKSEEENSDLSKELSELEKAKESATRIHGYVKEYDKICGDMKLDFLGNRADEKDYELLINNVKKYLRVMKENRLSESTKNIDYAKAVLEEGVTIYQEKLNKVNKIETSLNDIENKIIKKRVFDNLVVKRIEVKKQIGENHLRMVPINRVETFGKEKVFENIVLYKSRIEKISSLNASISYYIKESRNLSFKMQELKNEIQKLGKDLDYENSIKEIEKIVGIFNKLQIQITQLNTAMLKSKELVEYLNVQKDIQRSILYKIEAFHLPEQIDTLSILDIQNVELVLNEKQVEKIKYVENSYRNISDSLKLHQEQISKINNNNMELEELCRKGRTYLEEHHDVKQCPLCLTPFDSWQILFQKVNTIQKDNCDFVIKNIQDISEKIKKLSDEYIVLRNECMNSKLEKISEQKKVIEDFENKKNEEHKVVSKNRYDLDGALFSLKECEIILEQKDVILPEVSLEGVKQWQFNLMNKLDSLSNSLTESNMKSIEMKKLEKELTTNLNDIILQQESVVKDTELYGVMKILIDQPITYKYEEERQVLLNQLSNYTTTYNTLLHELKEYQEVESMDLDSYIVNFDKEKEIFDKLKYIKQESKIFHEISEIGVRDSLDGWTREQMILKRQIELLEQISEESGARYYFEKYRGVKEKLENNRKYYLGKLGNKESAEVVFEEKKQGLEQGLKKYFGNTMINEIYRKIDPHEIMKNIDYKLSFSDIDEPQLFIQVSEGQEGTDGDSYRPEWYFSTAQLNTLAFSSFFSRAVMAEELPISTIFIDDPIGHFDDMNILGFVDLIRSVLESNNCQIIITTHDEKVFRIFERKLSVDYYSSCFIKLPDDAVKESDR